MINIKNNDKLLTHIKHTSITLVHSKHTSIALINITNNDNSLIHIKHTSITIIDMKNNNKPQSDDFNFTTRNPWFSSFLVSRKPLFKEIKIGTTNSVLLYQLKEIYSICRYCWNVATYKGKLIIGRLKSFVLS